MQYQNYGMHQNMHPAHGGGVNMAPPGQSQRREESFQSQATVFILKDKTWREQSQGAVQFVFDLNTYALRLIISPGSPEEMDRRLRPRIRSKGPRAYVVRAQAPNNGEDSILAVRFEREEDSQNFRKFVEKRDVDNNPPTQHNSNRIPNQHANPNAQAAQTYNQQYQPNNMYQNMNQAMMYKHTQAPQQQYSDYYRNDPNYPTNYYPSPSPQGYDQYRGNAPASTMAQPATTPHQNSQHQSIYSQNGANGGYGNGNNGQLVHRPTGSHGNQWGNAQQGPSSQPHGQGAYPSNEGMVNDPYGNNGNGMNQNGAPIDPNSGMPVNNGGQSGAHYSRQSGGGTGAILNSGNGAANDQPRPPETVKILKLTEVNLEAHNKVYAESSMANKRKTVRDIILEQISWQKEHAMRA